MSSQQYNAFISYRRTARDTAVAKEIQHSLERFRVPAGIRRTTGRDKIDRIFRDQEELEITSNLSKRIEDALQASEYLIVICSPQYTESPWCLHELETFIQLRGRDHVLCVLSDGEPPAVFPEQLLHCKEETVDEDGNPVTVDRAVEPLACDYRGSFKAARRTELPRLAAVLLGCSYDELVMRQEKYRRRRLAAVLSSATALAMVAVAYLLWSNAKISENYRRSQISESRLLAMESLDAFEEQDRLKALKTALRALTGDGETRPVTDEAQFALSQASYAYFTPYQWLETWRIDEANDIESYFVSRDKNCLVCMDRTGVFRTYDLRTRRELCSFRVLDIGVPSTPIEGKGGELLCYAAPEVVSADYKTGEINWRIPLKYQAIGGVHRSEDGAYIAAEDAFAVQILSEDGEPYLSLPLPDLDGLYITNLCWSPDNSRIAIQLKQTGNTQYRIGVFNVESSEFSLLEPVFQSVDLFCFDDDDVLYVLGDDRIEDSAVYGSTTIYATTIHMLSAFREETILWNQVLPAHTMTDSYTLKVHQGAEKRIFLGLGSTVCVFDENGGLKNAVDLHEDVRTILTTEDDSFRFITWKGNMGTAYLASGSSVMEKSFPAGMESVEAVQADNRGDSRYVVCVSGNLYIYESVSDTNISIFEGESFVKHPDTLLRSGDRLMLMTDASLRFYDLPSRTEIRNVALGPEAAWHPLSATDGVAYLLRIDGESGELSVVARDMGTGEELREDRLSVYDFFQRNEFLKAPYSREDALYLDTFYSSSAPVTVRNDCVYLHDAENSRVITACRLSDGTVTKMDLTEAVGEDVELLYEEKTLLLPAPLAVSPDQHRLLTACTDRRDGSRSTLLVDLTDGSVTRLPGAPDDLSSVAFLDNGVVYSGDREIYVCGNDGTLKYSIPYRGDRALSFGAYQERLYCVYPDGSLTIYENGEEIRTVPLSFYLGSDAINGKAFRYEFYPTRLYLFCGAELNVITLDSDGSTAVYYAASVLEHLEDRGELLVFSYDPKQMGENGERNFHLASFRELSVEELIARGQEQLKAYVPDAPGENRNA